MYNTKFLLNKKPTLLNSQKHRSTDSTTTKSRRRNYSFSSSVPLFYNYICIFCTVFRAVLYVYMYRCVSSMYVWCVRAYVCLYVCLIHSFKYSNAHSCSHSHWSIQHSLAWSSFTRSVSLFLFLNLSFPHFLRFKFSFCFVIVLLLIGFCNSITYNRVIVIKYLYTHWQTSYHVFCRLNIVL